VNPHEVLGVRPGASPDEVRAAWRRRARATHPDRGGDEEAFSEVLEAYRRLTGERSPRVPGSGVPVVFFRSRGATARASRWLRRRRAGRSSSRVV
jgi:hypothetical protein